MEDSKKLASGGAGTPLYDNLRKVVNLIDELRDIGLQQHISLPRIAVLGTQSAGKSSLLESIVGMDFLPRGDGVVTRRPLELRLVHVPHSQHEKPYAIFEKFKDKRFTDFDKVRDMINQLTDEVAGATKGIVDNPIILTVYAYSCPDLTLVDLPGITRIPIAGQQHNIEQVTKEMAKRYCGDPRTIILAVVPANADMSTSDALQMAMELDPKGTRTLGVVTKIDIMDRGTNAKKMILGEEVGLRLGYVGVKGRSKADIDSKVTVRKGLEEEKQFFASHPVYSTMPPGFLGIETLTQKLTKILFHHIRSYLPEIMKEISIKIKDCEDRLKELGTSLPTTTKDKVQLLWQLITKFTENFKNALSGRYTPNWNLLLSSMYLELPISRLCLLSYMPTTSAKITRPQKTIQTETLIKQSSCTKVIVSLVSLLLMLSSISYNLNLKSLKNQQLVSSHTYMRIWRSWPLTSSTSSLTDSLKFWIQLLISLSEQCRSTVKEQEKLLSNSLRLNKITCLPLILTT
jgi:GTP-binding protein EngB required for normal cell division